ncbi:MAG: hypothetical protein VYC98_12040, partial [Planctomycetota bacterium]|nr:hypothetical protein [Planctomycetota bacterium]
MLSLPSEMQSALEQHNQAHVVQFWKELGDDERAALLGDLESLDLALLQRLYEQPEEAVDWHAMA